MATKPDYAVVVGISTYPFLKELGLSKLEGPENDADDFYNWLITDGKVPKTNIALIRSRDFSPPPEPTKPEPWVISQAFEKFCDLGRTQNGQVGRRLYIYMAGHGIAPNADEVALLTANAAKGKTPHIPGRLYANWIFESGYFDEVVLFMDCCRQNFKRSNWLYPYPCDGVSSARKVRRFYGFATGWSRTARERPLGQAGQVRGLFTMALLEGLRGGARVNGKVTGSSLAGFVQKRVGELAQTDERQEPQFEPASPAIDIMGLRPGEWVIFA